MQKYKPLHLVLEDGTVFKGKSFGYEKPVAGEVVTEIEAISLLTGASAEHIAGGGVSGAEGAIWLAVDGTDEQIKSAMRLLNSIIREPNFEF